MDHSNLWSPSPTSHKYNSPNYSNSTSTYTQDFPTLGESIQTSRGEKATQSSVAQSTNVGNNVHVVGKNAIIYNVTNTNTNNNNSNSNSNSNSYSYSYSTLQNRPSSSVSDPTCKSEITDSSLISKRRVLYTVGYAKMKDPKLMKQLAQNSNSMVCDIRLSPRTSFPGWAKESLQKLLGDRYIWIQAFGNENHHTGMEVKLRDPSAGLQMALELLQQFDNLILLCGCKDYHSCHRKTTAEFLQKNIPNVDIQHV